MPQPIKLGAVNGILIAALAFAIFATSHRVDAAAPQNIGYHPISHLDRKPGLWAFAVHNSQILPRTIVDTRQLEQTLKGLQVDADALAEKDANGKIYISKADAQLRCAGAAR